MNAKETGMVLEMITAHYWQTPKTAERNAELMVRTWQKTLAEVPLQPHIELALDEWFRTEKWPPQASELRELAMELGGPTPLMIAEAEAWQRRSAFAKDLRMELNERCTESIDNCMDAQTWDETYKARVQEFWDKTRREMGLPAESEPTRLRVA
jgi:hypothetical protein